MTFSREPNKQLNEWCLFEQLSLATVLKAGVGDLMAGKQYPSATPSHSDGRETLTYLTEF